MNTIDEQKYLIYQHQLRSVMSQYERYRASLRAMIARGVRKPAAQASLALVGTLVLIAALGILVLRPTLLTVSGLIKEIQDERKLVEALDDKLRTLVLVEGMMADMKDDLPRVDWAAPPDQELGIFAKEIEILAKEKGLTAVEISQAGFRLIGAGAAANNQGEAKFLEVRAAMGGSEEAVREFLADLIRMDRVVLLKSVNVSSVPKDRRQEEPYQVRAAATMEIMWSKE